MKIIRSIETLNKALNYNFGTAKKFEFFEGKTTDALGFASMTERTMTIFMCTCKMETTRFLYFQNIR